MNFDILGLSPVANQMVKSDLTSDPKRPLFWPNYWVLRCNGHNFVKFGLQMFWRLLINMVKSDFISDSTWPPFWPIYWPLRSKGRKLMNFGLQMFWRLLINMVQSEFISNLTWPPYWPHFIFWEIMAGFSWNLISGGYHLWRFW